MIDTFYQDCEENGIQFQVRYTDLMREDRTMDIPDEEKIKAELQQKEEEEESKRDCTY